MENFSPRVVPRAGCWQVSVAPVIYGDVTGDGREALDGLESDLQCGLGGDSLSRPKIRADKFAVINFSDFVASNSLERRGAEVAIRGLSHDWQLPCWR